MIKRLPLLLLICGFLVNAQKIISVQDSISKTPISYATVSFGDGKGLFADNEGQFYFTKKLYSDIDSLYISAIGYKELKISTQKLPELILLSPDVSQLKEVFLTNKKLGKYKTRERDPFAHNDYFRCWLPTVESEIAVLFTRNSTKSTKIAEIHLPIKRESSQETSGKIQSFSTLFKAQFYKNDSGKPGKRLGYENIIFKITDKDKKVFKLNISDREVFIPKTGIFVSIQVLGYTNKKGKLQNTKKYHEVKTKRGIAKISTTFRPLLPFTNKISPDKTFTRRIFHKKRTWQKFDRTYSKNNNLILSGNNNYGMGLKLHVFEEKTPSN